MIVHSLYEVTQDQRERFADISQGRFAAFKHADAEAIANYSHRLADLIWQDVWPRLVRAVPIWRLATLAEVSGTVCLSSGDQ